MGALPAPAAAAADYGTPSLWNVCFCGTKRNFWFDRLLAPGFRHVFMTGYVAGFNAWLLYEVLFPYSTLAIVSMEFAAGKMTAALHEGDVLTVRPEFHVKRRIANRAGLYCVPAVSHALGLRCVAVTPRQLHRYLLARGAKSLKAGAHESFQHTEGQA